MKIKMKFHFVAKKYAGTILLHNYGDKTLAFTPLATPIAGIMCECGNPEWNATNFGNNIHFCPNREYQFEVTNFQAVQ